MPSSSNFPRVGQPSASNPAHYGLGLSERRVGRLLSAYPRGRIGLVVETEVTDLNDLETSEAVAGNLRSVTRGSRPWGLVFRLGETMRSRVCVNPKIHLVDSGLAAQRTTRDLTRLCGEVATVNGTRVAPPKLRTAVSHWVGFGGRIPEGVFSRPSGPDD